MHALVLRQLTKVYKNGIKALKAIDLQVDEGDFFALLGPNGAGKTTAIGITTSLVNKTSGTVEVFGHDIDKELEAAKSCIGLVPQEINFNMFETPFTIVVNQAGFYGIPRPLAKQRAEKYLKQLQLWDRRNSTARALSGGMKRRLVIARSLINDPDILLLDEPTTGLDPQARHVVWDRLFRLKQRGVTLILTTHYMDEAEQLCDRLVVMDHGTFAAEGSPRDLIARYCSPEVLELRFGPDRHELAADKLRDFPAERAEVLADRILLYVTDGDDALAAVRSTGLEPLTSLVRRGTLEDVFLRLTGRRLED